MPTVDPVILQLVADVAKYNRDVADATRQTQRNLASIELAGLKIGNTMRSAFGLAKEAAVSFFGVLAAQSLVQATKAALDYAGSIGETAQALGVGTKFLQEFRYAAMQNGSSLEGADNALAKFSATLGKAFDGKKQAVEAVTKALQGTGKTLADLGKMSETDRYTTVADGIAKIGDAAQRTAAKQEIFGKGFKEVGALLDGGAAAFRNAAAEAQQFGLILTNGQIQNADAVADKIERLNAALSARLSGFIADNAQAIGNMAEQLFKLAEGAIAAVSAYNRWNSMLGVRNGSNIEGGVRSLASSKEGRNDLRARVTNQLARLQRDRSEGKFTYQTNDNGIYGDTQQRRIASDADKKQQARQRQALLRTQQNLDRIDRNEANPVAPERGNNATITPVAGGKGATGKSAAELQKEQDRVTRQFNDALARAQQDLLQAMADLSGTIEAQAAADTASIELERKTANEDVQLRGELSAARKAQLIAENDKVAAARAQVVADKLASQQRKRVVDIADTALDLEDERLRGELEFARTAKERLDIETSMIAIAIERKKLALQLQLADEKDLERKKSIQSQIEALGAQGNAQQRAAEKRNQSPLGKYLDDIPKTADQINEALQNVAVDGLKSLNEGIVDAITGSKSLGEVFSNLADQIVADLLRIAIQQAVIKPLASALFGDGGDSGGGGGFLGSVLGGIGKVFGGGGIPGFGRARASGGYVGAGDYVRVNEGANSNRVEGLRMGPSGGTIIPLGQMNAQANAPAQAQAGTAVVRLVLSEDLNARIGQISGNVAVQVVTAAAPGLVDAAADTAIARANRYTLP